MLRLAYVGGRGDALEKARAELEKRRGLKIALTRRGIPSADIITILAKHFDEYGKAMQMVVTLGRELKTRARSEYDIVFDSNMPNEITVGTNEGGDNHKQIRVKGMKGKHAFLLARKGALMILPLEGNVHVNAKQIHSTAMVTAVGDVIRMGKGVWRVERINKFTRP